MSEASVDGGPPTASPPISAKRFSIRGSTDGELLGALWRTCLRRALPREPLELSRRLLGLLRQLALTRTA